MIIQISNSLFLIISLILIPLSPIPDIQAQENISNIQNLSYTYDNIGNMISIEDSSVLPTSKTITYTYDDLDRLTSAQTSNLSYGDYTKTYQYDSIGNMVYKSDVGVMSYGGTGFPNPHALTASGTKTYSYDLNGNLLNNTSNQFAWNARNQLVQSGDYSFTYDYSGQRIKSINASSGEKTIFVNKYLEIRPDSALYYFWAGPTRIASLEISKNAEGSLNDPSTGIITYFHQDHLGSVALATNENGEVIQINDYAPYGSITYNDSSSSSQSPYSFSGKEYSSDLGLYYFEARWYDPEVGRFVSEDPAQYQKIEKIIIDPQTLNFYTYSRNNPLTYVDPDGESAYLAMRLLWYDFSYAYFTNQGSYISGNLLRHSLQINPSDKIFNNQSYVANTIRETKEYEDSLTAINEAIRNGKRSDSDDIKFQTGDLATSIHKATLSWTAKPSTKSVGAYDIQISITDTYNFEWKDNYGNSMLNLGNNIAVGSQAMMVINEYEIKIKMNETLQVHCYPSYPSSPTNSGFSKLSY